MVLLENNRIKLRPLEPEDIDLLYQWENDSTIWQVSNTLVPFSRYVLKQYIESSHQSIFETAQLKLIIEPKADKKAVGAIDLFDFDVFHQRAGVGILIHHPSNRGKGYASEALQLMIEYSFNYLKLNQLYCNIDTTNAASLKLFQNAGFEINGTKKQWINSPTGWLDELFLQKFRL